MDAIRQIKDRLNIEDVIGSYIQMKKAGRNFKACCPFHNEKSPSFVISPEKQIAHCFGCHWGGDVIKFVQDYEKVEFPEALETLASRAGIELPKKSYDAANKSEKEVLKNIHRDAVKFFQKELERSPKIQEFLRNRGLTEKTISDFAIGYCPDDYHATHAYLEKEGYTQKDLIRSGLVSQKNLASSEIFDRFRGRVMFPIWDISGSVIGFGGRVLGDLKEVAKYVNSPDTPLYSKGAQVYGFNFAKDFIRESKQVIIVEGYFDVITAHQGGYRNVVASSGTALTETQLKLLKRHADEIIFCFDHDSAGENAALRSIALAQELDIPVKILQVPDGKDPDECIRTSPESWDRATKRTIPYMDYVLQTAVEKQDIGTVNGKKSVVAAVLPTLAHIANAVEREHYLKELATKTGTGMKALLEELTKVIAKQKTPRSIQPTRQSDEKQSSGPKYRTEQLILSLLLSEPELIEKYSDQISADWFGSEPEKSLYINIISHYNQSGLSVPEANILKLIGEEYYHMFSDKEREKELQNLIGSMHRKRSKNRIEELKTQLNSPSTDSETKHSLLQELSDLLKSQPHG